ncbi:MAG: outer membrane beta-barrel protein [Saprospiraceae bacterium]
MYSKKKFSLSLLIILSIFFEHSLAAQDFIVKGGLNYANISKAKVSSFNSTSKSGYFAGIGITPGVGLVRFNSELLYSKQGYDYKNGTTRGAVDLQYLLFPQSVSLNFGYILQIHTGLQFGFISNIKIDSSSNTGQVFDLENIAKNINKVNVAILGGVEVSPIRELFFGLRYNHGLGNFLKKNSDDKLVFAPDKNLKNNLIQIYAGLKFSLARYSR